MAVDVTFGVNKERREELIVAGIDGHNKIFTAFYCFMPSKQQVACSWAINEAMPFLLGNETLKFSSCFTSDNELAMTTAMMDLAIKDSSNSAFFNAKRRADFFHIFLKPFLLSDVSGKIDKNSSEGKRILVIIKAWIKSWFDYIDRILVILDL